MARPGGRNGGWAVAESGAAREPEETWLTQAEVEHWWPQIRPECIADVARANGVRIRGADSRCAYHADDVDHLASALARGAAEVEPWQRADAEEEGGFPLRPASGSARLMSAILVVALMILGIWTVGMLIEGILEAVVGPGPGPCEGYCVDP